MFIEALGLWGVVMFGLFAVDGGFELLCGDTAVGARRHLDASAVGALEGFSRRYCELLRSPHAAAGLLALGRDLYSWLNSDGQLTTLLQRGDRPLRFEVCAGNLIPSAAEWALLRAPWELLADQQGFLAGDVQLRFSPVRRLGREATALGLDKHRLGLVFMAASPRGARELDYEAEETAIMTAVGSTKLDLLVEESGNPDELGERLTDYATMQAVHLSCHGDNAWRPLGKPMAQPKPVLLLETLEGEELPTDAGELIGALRAHRPRLVFLSACLTAAAGAEGGLPGGKEAAAGLRGGVAHSLAEALVNAGLPAVLGWDGSVADEAATAFAATLYDGLEGQDDLADAVAAGRRALLNASEESKRRDWHLARLWYGPQGGGPIVGGKLRRRMMPATQGQKEFLAKARNQIPVASQEMFVGLRRELQKALRVFGEEEYAGVLLHGMGRVGKSSLAARIANRRRDLRVAVVFEHYGSLDVLGALAEALKENPKARDFLRDGTNLVRQQPDRLEGLLIDLLCGPCAQTEAEGTPVLLVIDDLERILDADPKGGRHRVKPEHAPVLGAVLRAFDAAIGSGLSRLVITSRFTFTLGGVEDRLFELPLPPLSEAAQRKLELRQREAAADAGLTGQAFAEREKLLARVPGIARGNPGLQDLIGRKLILGLQEDPIRRKLILSPVAAAEDAQRTLDEIEAWLAQGDLPSDAEVREFLKDLAIDALRDLAGKAGQALLRGLTVFDVPVPEVAAATLEAHLSGSLRHLRDLGLVDVSADLVDARQTGLSVNALAAGRLAPLSDSERTKLAREVAGTLFRAWGGAEGEARRPAICDVQLTQLGLLAEDGAIVAACATPAVIALRQGPAEVAAELGGAAIGLLDAQHRVAPWRLLSETAGAAATSGDGATADTLLERGVAALEEQRHSGATVDPVAAGFLVYEQAQRLVTRGELGRAEDLFAEAAQLAEAAGNEVSATIARGQIADILESRGDLDEALRIRKEEELPVYERLGAVRERAVTMGQIADILVSRGDLDEALRIRQEEELPVYERLGAVRARAVTMGQIADILFSRGDLDEALRIRKEEQLPVYERLGDVRSRAVTMGKIADILFSRGDLDEALRIRKEEELPVYERLGAVRERAVTMGRIADILVSRGDLDEALRIRQEEELPVYERLGDVRSRAVTMGRIADILVSRGDLDEALRIRQEEQLPVYERLGDVRSRAVTMGRIADILVSRGDLDEALRIRQEEELPVYERLGAVRERAVTMGQIADILFRRGDLDEALRIRKEEELPVYERLGEVRERAVTMGRIADILFSRGDLDEALRIRQEEELPVYERLGDVRSRAVTMGQIADILFSRGDLDEALRIRQEEQLPVYERLGAVRSRAVTLGKIADILVSRGDLDEALRIRQEEQLPVYERLGDVRSRAVTMGRIADILVSRGDLDEALRILKEEELPVYERLGDVRSRAVTMGRIADILVSRGDLDEALRIRQEEELPVYERLGAVRSRAVTLGKIADILHRKGDLGAARALHVERLEINRRLVDAEGIANTLWGLAQLDLQEQKIGDAVPRIVAAYDIVSRLGRADAIAVLGTVLGQILAANEKPDDARIVLQRSADMYRKLGLETNATEVDEIITRLKLR